MLEIGLVGGIGEKMEKFQLFNRLLAVHRNRLKAGQEQGDQLGYCYNRPGER